MVMGRVMPVMSISWNASEPRTLLPTWPVMATMGMRVEHGGGDAGDEVGGAGAGGGDADADLAGGAGVAVGHVRGALLVADEDVVDGELAQGVVGGEDGSARVAEDVVHAFAGEGGPDDFGSGELGVLIFVCHDCLLQFVLFDCRMTCVAGDVEPSI